MIELCHNRSLEDPWMQARCKQCSVAELSTAGLDDEMRRHHLAWNLLASLADEVSLEYENAAMRCFTNLDCRENKLEEEQFRMNIYEQVLGPLKRTLERMCKVDE